ncbi:Sterile alpha and TIR motif-containing protein 1 [Anabarilius grahami]|uniref:NAD(+) hydrolase SARM1 n=1 Tax=Anabarilius grahami TaxID=495550 RepID=A0A3N0Z4C7_ANAGA|nr:Sterile alpha and TIR motif-containing protein 1 [Anabarilius grahami]
MSQPDPFQALVDTLWHTLTVNPPPPPIITSPSPAPAVTTVNTVISPSPPVYASPMAKPAPYSGSAEDCSGFLLQCELVLEMQPHQYPNDTSKIAFLISQLSGKALKWADSIWSQHGVVTQSYSAFISHFREVFGKPISDSAGEKLYNLKQGSMSIYDYALQFRTLAAISGWNEQALITTFRQGLEPWVRLHLAAYEDSIGLEKFIQLAIRCTTRMHACLQEHQGQSLSTSLLCRSEPVSSPEPANEPMEVENSRLTPSERQRRLTLNLCLYCGAPGHAISACPTRPPRPMVSAIIPSLRKMKPLTTVVNLAGISLTVVALLNSGSAGNFISGALCRQLRLKTSPSPTIYQINSLTGKPLSRKQVRRVVGPIQLRVGLLHMESIHLLVLEDSTADVVLGRPWLEQHNPTISWRTGEILKWGETCFSHCFSDLPIPQAPSNELSICATSIESPVEKRSIDIPEFLRDLRVLKTYANYSTCDPNNLADWLADVDPRFRQYTYGLIQSGVDRNNIAHITDQQLLSDCHVENGIHRAKILSTARRPAKPCLTDSHPTGPDVFISYRRTTGSQLASLLKVHLQLRGFSVFIDVEKLEAGRFEEKLITSVQRARNFILVLSANALDKCMGDVAMKDWVHKEIVTALNGKKNIVPVTDNFVWPDPASLPEDMSTILKFNGIKWSHEYQEATISKILRFLKGCPSQEQPDAAKTDKKEPEKE